MYENAFGSAYEELKTYYPAWYRDVKEMDAIWQAHGGQLDAIQAGVTLFVLNNFIATADQETIARWERFLYITYDGPRTLEERRLMVSSFFLGNGHIGEKEIKEIMSAFTEGQIDVDLIGGTVYISVTRDVAERFNLSDGTFILTKRIPAHLALVFNDVMLPIRFVSGSVFRLERLWIESSFYNYGAARVRLNGKKRLNGQWKLNQGTDGGLVLKTFQVSFGVPNALKGNDLKTLTLIALPFLNKDSVRQDRMAFLYRISNVLTAETLFQSIKVLISTGNHYAGFVGKVIRIEMPAQKNENVSAFFSFKSQAQAKTGNGFIYPKTMCGLQVKNHNSLTGTLLMDSMYQLNGAVQLDGSRKLNADTKKEVI